VPDATTVKVTVWPAVTLWLVGEVLIAGAVEGGDELPVVLLVVPVVVPAQPAATQTTKKQRAHVRRRFIMEAPSRLPREIRMLRTITQVRQKSSKLFFGVWICSFQCDGALEFRLRFNWRCRLISVRLWPVIHEAPSASFGGASVPRARLQPANASKQRSPLQVWFGKWPGFVPCRERKRSVSRAFQQRVLPRGRIQRPVCLRWAWL
jgi:hypothetical protein